MRGKQNGQGKSQKRERPVEGTITLFLCLSSGCKNKWTVAESATSIASVTYTPGPQGSGSGASIGGNPRFSGAGLGLIWAPKLDSG
jgi:hypothetical protein